MRTKLQFWGEELSPEPVSVSPGGTHLETLEKGKAAPRVGLSEQLLLFLRAPL